MITIHAALVEGRRRIEALGSDEAALEAELLMMHALGIDRARLYERLNGPLDPNVEKVFETLLARRLEREPVAYITGRREFYGLDFEASPAALIPRPETETIVEVALEFAHSRGGIVTIADIGTGGGAIASALARELPDARIIATDESGDALALAKRNAERLAPGRIDFRLGDLLSPLGATVDIIVANLPYVTTEQWKELPPEIREHEPRPALDGGADGLDPIRRLISEAPEHLVANGALFCEIGDWQGAAVRKLAEAAFPRGRISIRPDLAGRDRVLCVYC